jgi:hypothetical protein
VLVATSDRHRRSAAWLTRTPRGEALPRPSSSRSGPRSVQGMCPPDALKLLSGTSRIDLSTRSWPAERRHAPSARERLIQRGNSRRLSSRSRDEVVESKTVIGSPASTGIVPT